MIYMMNDDGEHGNKYMKDEATGYKKSSCKRGVF